MIAITVTDVNTNARATSFGVVAPGYDKWRPSYPREQSTGLRPLLLLAWPMSGQGQES
jgi:hypothetical protein